MTFDYYLYFFNRLCMLIFKFDLFDLFTEVYVYMPL